MKPTKYWAWIEDKPERSPSRPSWGMASIERERRAPLSVKTVDSTDVVEPMDRPTLEHHLAVAQRHVVEGINLLSRQEKIVAKLERDGRDTADALTVLDTLRETQKLHEQDVERILVELKQAGERRNSSGDRPDRRSGDLDG